MTYCEQHLKRIYQNYLFSARVYQGKAHYLDCLLYQALNQLDLKTKVMKGQGYPAGDLFLYRTRYRTLILNHYYAQAQA